MTLPFIADRLIVSAMSEAKDVGIGGVIGMAIYTAAPFVLLDSAMRPRRRVRLAMWMGPVSYTHLTLPTIYSV